MTKRKNISRYITTRGHLEWDGQQYRYVSDEGYWYDGEIAQAGGTPQIETDDWNFYTDDVENASGNEVDGNNNNTDPTLDVDTVYQVRWAVSENGTAVWTTQDLQLEYNYDSQGWVDVNATSTHVQSAAGGLVEANDTTNRITGQGTFQGSACQDETDGLTAGVDRVDTEYINAVYSFQIIGSAVDDAKTFDLRITDAVEAWTAENQALPTVTVNKASTPDALLANDVESASEVSTPTVVNDTDFFANVQTVDTSTSNGIYVNQAFEVDWGDGTWDPYAAGVANSVAAGTGAVRVRSNNSPTYWYPNTDTFTSVDISQSSTLTSLNYSFSGYVNLTSVTVADASSITDLGDAFNGCTGLTTISLTDTSSCDTWTRFVSGCTGLTSLPAFDYSGGRYFVAAWRYLTLESLPVLNTTLGETFTNALRDCPNLVCIGGLDTRNQTVTTDLFTDSLDLLHPNAGERASLLTGSLYTNPGTCPADDLLANDVESASEVSTPALAEIHALLADDVESASDVSIPSVGQKHALLAEDVESASEVSIPSVGQKHVLLADDVESASEVSTPTLTENAGADNLLADDVESASEVSTPTIGQEHGLLADDVESASEVSVPSIGQEHGLLAEDVESASEVSSPSIGQEHSLLAENVESASEITTPSLSETHGLLAEDVESASEVSTPTIGQEHSLLAEDVESASEVTIPTIAQEHVLLADDVESASEVTSPTIGQEHSLLANDVESASEVSIPSVTDVSGTTDVCLAENVESASEVSTPTLIELAGLIDNEPSLVISINNDSRTFYAVDNNYFTFTENYYLI